MLAAVRHHFVHAEVQEEVGVVVCVVGVGGVVDVVGVVGVVGVLDVVGVVVVVYFKRLRIVLRCAKAGCGRRTSSS